MTTPSLLARLSADEIKAATARFRACAAAGELSPQIKGVCRIKRLDGTGDTEVIYPRVSLADLPHLTSDEQIAIAAAEEIIAAARQASRSIVATTPGTTAVAPVGDFSVDTAPEEIVILNAVIGG